MIDTPDFLTHTARGFAALYGTPPTAIASAPGRLEVLGNHTDYNAGRTLSCAVPFRCFAALALLGEPTIKIASSAYGTTPKTYLLDGTEPDKSHWANYVLGLVKALQDQGHHVPGFALLIDSAVPRSAGVSSSAALEMSVLTGLAALMRIDLPPIQLAKIGQSAESTVVGAQTGLLDQLTSLLGQRDHLLQIDFQTLDTQTIPMPPGWCFVGIDSGVKHDLTGEYNQRRQSCEQAASTMGVASLRDATSLLLQTHRASMGEDAWRCAKHVIDENKRVTQAREALARGDVETMGQLMFASHASSRDYFRNSCDELDALVQFAHGDPRCIGARLSGGGFGGITIHLVHQDEAEGYMHDLLKQLGPTGDSDRWAAICPPSEGACLHSLPNF